MGKFNIGRWILGGVVAAIIGNLLSVLVDSWLLASRWDAAMRMLGRPPFTATQAVEFDAAGLLSGLIAVWIYAAIRPRFGAGPKTAIYAGLVAWMAMSVFPNAVFMYIAHFFPRDLAVYTTLGGLVEYVVGTLAGAALYKDA